MGREILDPISSHTLGFWFFSCLCHEGNLSISRCQKQQRVTSTRNTLQIVHGADEDVVRSPCWRVC